jgi:hypothetical protein
VLGCAVRDRELRGGHLDVRAFAIRAEKPMTAATRAAVPSSASQAARTQHGCTQ